VGEPHGLDLGGVRHERASIGPELRSHRHPTADALSARLLPIFFAGAAVQWNVNSDGQSPGLITFITGFSNFGFLIGRTFPGTNPAAVYFGVTTKIDGLHLNGILSSDLSTKPPTPPKPPAP
jgi:hypothetical protein